MLVALFLSAGCKRWPIAAIEPCAPQSTDSRRTGSADQADPSPSSGGISPSDRSVLADGHWVLSTTPGGAAQDRSADPAGPSPAGSPRREHRWRHAKLEDLLARPPDRLPDFAAALDDEDAVVRAGAAIALARQGDPRAAETLAESVRGAELELPLRRAAAEALGDVPRAEALPRLDELLAQYGEFSGDAARRYVPELHAELIRSLARHVDAAESAAMLAALKSPSTDVRLEALRAWTDSRSPNPVPEAALDQRGHGDARLRVEAMRLVGRRRPPRAMEYLRAGLEDFDVEVRLAAIAALGAQGDGPLRDDAAAALEPLRRDHSDRIRAACVAAFGALGRWKPVAEAADDASWRVRAEVARTLRADPSPSSLDVLRRLLADPSAEVQMAAIEAMRGRPLAEAGPLLLGAMGGDGRMMRTAAARQLAERWQPAEEFPIDAPAERRREVLERLIARFEAEHGATADEGAPSAAPAEGSAEDSPPTDAQVAELRRRLAAGDIENIRSMGPALVPALERVLFDHREPLPDWVYHDVLPAHDALFAEVARLQSPEVLERRRAAEAILRAAKKEPLGRLAVERIARIVSPDPDALVWLSVLDAVGASGAESFERLAAAALSHPAPEVRRRACQWFSAFGRAENAPLLLPALEDPHPSVVCAAVEALGAVGRPGDVEALRPLLARRNEQIRLETAAALARLGDPAGIDELERLSHSADPAIRRQVAERIGQAGDTSLVPVLVRLLDDRVAVLRAALDALPKLVGRDIAAQGDSPPEDTTERVQRWKEWYRRSHASASSFGAPP